MRAFHTIAVPHNDILEGRLTMDVFAADLWEVYQGRAPLEYLDANEFFRKTYVTEGLKNILDVVEKRVSGKGGDPVIQIQTPFGGGKTHALIAMYHRAADWGAKPVVIVGTTMGADDTIWGAIEYQLTGQRVKFAGKAAPGREAMHELLESHQPVIILMDEVLEYATKAAAYVVGESTLAAQTIAFMQELTEVAGTIEKACVIVTLPSSAQKEQYDENAQRLFQQLQHVSGRVEKIYTPVKDTEISFVIRQRLFQKVNEELIKQNIQEFMDYALQESLLPPGQEPSDYRKRFQESYPFLPEVIDTLYFRWSTIPGFQKTRGVLRLLSLILYSLKEQGLVYITLSDFDLDDQEIRRELLKHTGAEFDGVIASDITSENSGSKNIDHDLGTSYQGLKLGTRAATSIFMYSFSGGIEKGAISGEIKRNATTTENPSSVISDALDKLRSTLFYLQYQDERYFFTNQPNLNRILVDKMDSVQSSQVAELERGILADRIGGLKLKVYLWPKDSSEIPDDQNLKLIILQIGNGLMKEILERKASTPRVNRNTLIFLTPSETERLGFENLAKKYLAYKLIQSDKTLNLTEDQRKDIKSDISKLDRDVSEQLRRYYRQIYIPIKDGFKELDLGVPTYGETKKIDDEVFDKLNADQEILTLVAPLFIKEKYLRGREYVLTAQLYNAGLTTPGEVRVIGRLAWEQGIQSGISSGIFGLGEFEDNQLVCRFYKEPSSVSFAENEVLIGEEVCKQQREKLEVAPTQPEELGGGHVIYPPTPPELPVGVGEGKTIKQLQLKLPIPKGKVSNLMGVLNFLQQKYENLELQISVSGGQMSEQEYEDKVKEAFRQIGINVED